MSNIRGVNRREFINVLSVIARFKSFFRIVFFKCCARAVVIELNELRMIILAFGILVVDNFVRAALDRDIILARKCED